MRVLYLEDDPGLRDTVVQTINWLDETIELEMYESGEQMLPALEANFDQFDLFMMDVRLPGNLNGLELAKRIRAMGYEGAIVLMSAYQRPSRGLLNALGCEWLPKPLDIETLAKLFQELRK